MVGYIIVLHNVLQCVAVCCSVLQRVAACCSVLQRVVARERCLPVAKILATGRYYILYLASTLAKYLVRSMTKYLPSITKYGVTTVNRIDKIIGLFCRIWSF